MSCNGDSGNGSSSGSVVVNVRHSNGIKLSVEVNLHSSVSDFKAVIAQNCDVPTEQQKLIYKGRILKDDQTLQDYGLQANHTVHMVRGLPAATANTSGAENGGDTNYIHRVPRSNDSTALGHGGVGRDTPRFSDFGVNSLGGSGLSDLYGDGLSEFEQVQQRLTRDPNRVREIMNMPDIQNLMNDPDLIRNLIRSNPQMREVIDRNPELAHILNDPSIMRQTLEAARNPEIMREMMRNTDRAMSNIESSPEGFNMLRRMYETVQEPLLNAGNSENDLRSDLFASLANQAGEQTRHQSTSLTTGSETTSASSAPNISPLPNPWRNARSTGFAQRNATIRSTPARDARAPVTAGVQIPGMDQMFGGTQGGTDLAPTTQNRARSQLMRRVLSDPQYMNRIQSLRAMLGSNPQMREMLRNPEAMQQILSLQQSLQSAGGPPSMLEPGQPGTGAGVRNTTGLGLLMNMLGSFRAGGSDVPNVSTNVQPEEQYATQLSQLQEMGFFDTQENLHALIATAGNVHAAVERLLGNFGQ